ncbi:hypothetical protein TNIN_325671 [Trichonephila inaurata madagascariensis]|uniref:Uncharacterized protein n=1 Tax=Trichonephila inaurata madagascariensis TaxID=2747483 RepID=A0A8X6Y507_9ARAC|nr:hypothetical protein TNIN_325671 [Trichonephila inaurata madagascariensis]
MVFRFCEVETQEHLKGISRLLKMFFILKTILLFVKTLSAIIEGVQKILQNICEVIESTSKANVSTALTKDISVQSSCPVTRNYCDFANSQPIILISNLSSTQQVTISYGDGDKSLAIPLPTKSATSEVQPIGNKLDRCGTSKPPSETANLHSEIPAVASNSHIFQSNEIHEFEDSEIQTKVMGKSTTSEASIRNICPTTNDQMSFVRGTKHHSRSFSSDKEAAGLGEHVPLENSCSGSVDALRPKKSPVTKRNLHDKLLRELCGRTAGIKRRHLKKNNGLDVCTFSPTSEENRTVVPFNGNKRLNLEETVHRDSNTSSYGNLDRITSLESKSLTEKPSPHKNDSYIDCKSNLAEHKLSIQVNACQDVVSKDIESLSTPNMECVDDSTSETDSHNVKINENMTDSRPTLHRQIDSKAGLLRDLPRTSTQGHASSETKDFSSTRRKNAESTSKRVTACELCQEIAIDFMRKHFEWEYRGRHRKREKTPVAETERDNEENEYEMASTTCKEQTEEKLRVKTIEEDKNSELEALNSSEEEYIKQELDTLSKIATENEEVPRKCITVTFYLNHSLVTLTDYNLDVTLHQQSRTWNWNHNHLTHPPKLLPYRVGNSPR